MAFPVANKLSHSTNVSLGSGYCIAGTGNETGALYTGINGSTFIRNLGRKQNNLTLVIISLNTYFFFLRNDYRTYILLLKNVLLFRRLHV